MVSLTATGDGRDRFDLTQRDLEHPEVLRRLHAAKPLRLVESTAVAGKAGKAIAEETLRCSRVSPRARLPGVLQSTGDRSGGTSAALGIDEGIVPMRVLL
ncbi:MAG: hypothetical protein R2705_11540 [Ilumatobacteraceae bacterium]